MTAAAEPGASAHSDHPGPPWDAPGQQVPLAAGNPITNLNELFTFLALEEPGGFAGIHLEDGAFVVQMVEPDRARAGVMRWIRQFYGEELRGGPVGFQRADRSFAELMSWYATFQHVVFTHGAIWTDVRESANRLEAGLEPGTDFPAVRAALAEAGVPGAVYALVPDRPEPLVTQTLDSVFRPVVGGVNAEGCTLGLNVNHWNLGRGVVTAAHCTGDVGQVDDIVFEQPTGGSGIGTEAVDPPFWTGTHPETGESCPSWASGGCRYADAALVEYDTGVPDSLGFVARPGCSDCQGTGAVAVDAQDPTIRLIDEKHVFAEGQSLHKIGHETGWTVGEVDKTCIHVDANQYDSAADHFPPGTALLCQVEVDDDSGDPLTQEGDSGSPAIVDVFDGKARLLGLVWAGSGGSGVVSRISGVRNDLDPNTSLACDGLETLAGGGCDGPDGGFDECTGDRESFRCEADGSW